MSKILIAGAGGAPSEGVINSLLRGQKAETVIGMGSEPSDLVLSQADKNFYVPFGAIGCTKGLPHGSYYIYALRYLIPLFASQGVFNLKRNQQLP